jgi:hypothetical protein
MRPFLNEEEKMEFEERAAIMEYDGGLSRTEAEWKAWHYVTKLKNIKDKFMKDKVWDQPISFDFK